MTLTIRRYPCYSLRHGTNIKLYINPSDDESMAAVRRHPSALRWVDRQTPEICLEAVRKNGLTLQWVKIKNHEIYRDICLAAVRQNGLALKWVRPEHRDEEICRAALDNNVLAVKWAKYRTPEDEMAAYHLIPRYIRYVTNKTPELCLEAIERDKRNAKYICTSEERKKIIESSELTSSLDQRPVRRSYTMEDIVMQNQDDMSCSTVQEKLRIEVIKKNPSLIAKFRNPSPYLQLIAVNESPECLAYIENPPEALKILAKQRSDKIASKN